ncbi:MAG: SDR family NAD(P)-dependent oxidoreductase, partial [Actinobacteria bacterium]|nr:SDR family NAD(P)-dependent oxidoreductase [Actinomycetota bacterium]
MGLEGRVALVTGGGRGIGRAIALALAEDGADIAVNYRKDTDSAAEVVAQIEKMGRRAVAYPASVASFDECAAMAEAVLGDFGFVDIIVNNAGIASRGQTVVDTEPEELQRVVATHAFGPHYLAKLLVPSMKGRGRGDIVMISSVATKSNGANGAPYSMGKAAEEALAITLSKELQSHGIRVNIVAPGLVETEMGRRLVKGARGIDDIATLHAAMPFGHVCQPEDVAGVVRFLVS